MQASSKGDVPYWLVNTKPSDRVAECPEFLQFVDETDKSTLGTLDKDFEPMTWAGIRDIVASNRMDKFRRVPSELRKYLEYIWNLKHRYGSVLRFILDERLRWTNVKPEDTVPFANTSDYKILFNDWPYGFVPGIVHLVVWVKFPLEDDPETGDMTKETRASIESFVAKTFHPHVSIENIVWFRNWARLKSVHAIEHFHIMMNNPDPLFVKTITDGDVALINRI